MINAGRHHQKGRKTPYLREGFLEEVMFKANLGGLSHMKIKG